jgi:penicillin amidase
MGVRKVLAGLAILLVLALVATAGAGAWATRRPLPETDGSVEIGGLDGRVDVYRDAFGVPHLYADTAADLFAAQGYVHAQDRFWEMDIRRHTTAGRLSELFGESQIETDRFIRTMGWRHVAEQEWELLADHTRAMFEAYASGVNAYLDGRTPGELSLEYAVLGLQRPGYEPEPWTPVDSVSWLKAMAWDLGGNHRTEIERVALTETLPVERVEELWPAYPFAERAPILPQIGAASGPDGPQIGAASGPDGTQIGEPAAVPDATAQRPPVPGDGGEPVAGDDPAPGASGDPARAAQVRSLLTSLGEGLAALPDLLGPAGAGLGSNSIVVSGSRTATGLPLLANDPHLGPALPSIWYQMALHCRTVSPACPYAVQGTTFSGMPGVVIGHNERIAWGFTNLSPDVSDLVLERLVEGGYEHRGGTLPLASRTETIRVAGGDEVRITVRETGHGPLVSDASGEMRDTAARAPVADGEPELAVALRWTALRPGRTADAILALNRARGWDELRAAAALFDVPAQNIVYADVDGSIGYQTPGWIPRRAPGDDGRWPVPGWTGTHDWLGRVPFEELPSVLNPEDGMIVTANQPVVSPEVGLFISADQAYGWRSQRLRDLLADRGSLAHEDLARIMMDTHNGIAETLVPLLVEVEVADGVRGAQSLLAAWDLQQSADSAAGAYFAAVWRHLLLRTFADDLPEDTEIDGGGRWMEVVRVLAATPDASWWDDLGTDEREDRDDMLRAAMVAAHRELSERIGDDPSTWRWGALHTLDLRHQTLGASGVAPLERVFNRGPVEAGGGGAIVNANAWTPTNGYEVDWVPSMRMISDPSNWDASRWVNLTGNSGHAFSDHYTDQVERWSAGQTIPMRWSAAAVRAAATGHLVLTGR